MTNESQNQPPETATVPSVQAASAQELSPEQIEFFIKLEAIFMPYATRQREEAYRKQGKSIENKLPIRLVHYTSASAALSIINSKYVWMRNATCMADYQEVEHGFKILHSFFSDGDKNPLIRALDACVPGAATEAITSFNQWWNGDIRFNTYITSISEHDEKEDLHGRLSMWRAFGGSTARVAMVFDLPWYSGAVQALNLFFSPVAYLAESEGHEIIREVIKNIEADCDFIRSLDRQTLVGMVFNMLVGGTVCVKHEGFREEREWRAIYFPRMRPSPLIQSETQVIAGVPQVIYKLPLDGSVAPILADVDVSRIFSRLIIGPSPYSAAMYQAFVDALTKANVPEAHQRVFPSGIPICS
jgi:hypothetical protein